MVNKSGTIYNYFLICRIMYKATTTKSNTQNIEQVTLTIERIYCSYCRCEINNLTKQAKKTQICSNCEFILNNSDYLVFSLHPDLNTSDIEAVKLLELHLNTILPIINLDSIKDISTRKFGVGIQDNKVIALFLDNADLLSYPDEINYFANLKVLSLANTKLTKLPESIDQLVNIEVMNLRDNNIEFLPDSISNLHQLKILDVARNQLRLLPDTFGDIQTLSYLNIENNLLYCLPKSFKSLKKLKILNIFDNQIKMDLVVDLLPKNLLNCGIGGNCVSNRSLMSLKRFFKKCHVHTQRQNWLKNEFRQIIV